MSDLECFKWRVSRKFDMDKSRSPVHWQVAAPTADTRLDIDLYVADFRHLSTLPRKCVAYVSVCRMSLMNFDDWKM